MRRMLSLPYTASCLECKSSSIAMSPCVAAPFEAIFAFFLGGVLSSESATINVCHAINILCIMSPEVHRCEGNARVQASKAQLHDSYLDQRAGIGVDGLHGRGLFCRLLFTRRIFACRCRQISAKTGISDASVLSPHGFRGRPDSRVTCVSLATMTVHAPQLPCLATTAIGKRLWRLGRLHCLITTRQNTTHACLWMHMWLQVVSVEEASFLSGAAGQHGWHPGQQTSNHRHCCIKTTSLQLCLSSRNVHCLVCISLQHQQAPTAACMLSLRYAASESAVTWD